MTKALENSDDDIADMEVRSGMEDAINAILDLAERPCGTMAVRLPQSPASERALIALYDAIGRNL